ncbi:Methyltransferase-like protein 17, mitochondrial [Perkinsus olseni]|uniref:Methyltransferase-like protein 17, mitochondrial n=1 Tax=Perkinsus olseni TaxID=32597 RepID=A0A7J6M7F9_PEROL|nr:Methyltransferase-like protein 17, mitochondrial [Perkinsus olseni]
MTSMRTMCGGLGEAMAADDTVRSLCNKVRPAIEQSNKSNAALSEFEPISYRSQVVAGTNYFVKIKVGPDAYAHARIFQPLPCYGSTPELGGVQLPCLLGGIDGGVEAEDESASSNPYVQWFQLHMNNEAITRGFKFDRHFGSPSELDPLYVVELDNLAMCTQKTNFLNPLLRAKIIRLLRDFGNKKDVERYARYVMQRQRSRSSTELPRVLSSAFLPEKEEDKDKTRLDRITKGQHFQELKHTMPELFDPERSQEISELQRLSIAHAEDSRHRLYQQFYSPEAAVAYLAHRFSPAYAVNFRVLHEVMKRCPDFKPTSILDYGSGPAPSVCAAMDVWGQRLIKQVTCIEPSVHMKQMGKYMLSDFSAHVEWSSQLYDSKNQRQGIITISYVLMHLKGQEARDLLVRNLWNRLEDGGVLVVIEAGTPTGFRFIHHIRELFIMQLPPKAFHFVAPCPHESMCPLATTGRDWCHFHQGVKRLPHYVYNKGSQARHVEWDKFSFLVVRKGVGPRQKYDKEEDAPTAAEKSYFWPRLLMPPIKAGGHTLVDACSAPNNFERLSVSKAKPHTMGYRFSRKVMWGDLWRFPKRVNRRNAREYVPEETKRHLERLAKKAYENIRGKKDHEKGTTKEEFKDEKQEEPLHYGK